MSAGVFLGVAAFAIVRTVLVIGGLFAIDFIGRIFHPKDQFGAFLMLAIVGVGTLCFLGITYFASGSAAAACVTAMGKLGKNRNVAAAIALSVLSSLIATVLLWSISMQWGIEMAGSEQQPISSSTLQILMTLEAIVGGLIAAVAAAIVGEEQVRSAKFCEECEAFLSSSRLQTFDFSGTKAIAAALESRDHANVAIIQSNGSSGNDGGTRLAFLSQMPVRDSRTDRPFRCYLDRR